MLNRRGGRAIATVGVVMVSAILLARTTTASPGAGRCSRMLGFPAPTGAYSIILATATSSSVQALPDSTLEQTRRSVPVAAQIMQVEAVGGRDAEQVREGLSVSRGRAVFVRYSRTTMCEPWAPPEGEFDSVSARGLYLPGLRARAFWVDDMPTFDLRDAHDFPLPTRLEFLKKNRPRSERRSKSLTASELFDLYSELWAPMSAPGDSTLRNRVRAYRKKHPDAAKRFPAPLLLGQP